MLICIRFWRNVTRGLVISTASVSCLGTDIVCCADDDDAIAACGVSADAVCSERADGNLPALGVPLLPLPPLCDWVDTLPALRAPDLPPLPPPPLCDVRSSRRTPPPLPAGTRCSRVDGDIMVPWSRLPDDVVALPLPGARPRPCPVGNVLQICSLALLAAGRCCLPAILKFLCTCFSLKPVYEIFFSRCFSCGSCRKANDLNRALAERQRRTNAHFAGEILARTPHNNWRS